MWTVAGLIAVLQGTGPLRNHFYAWTHEPAKQFAATWPGVVAAVVVLALSVGLFRQSRTAAAVLLFLESVIAAVTLNAFLWPATRRYLDNWDPVRLTFQLVTEAVEILVLGTLLLFTSPVGKPPENDDGPPP